MGKKKKITTRSLMTCVVLGAASAVFVWLAIALNTLLVGSVPWLAYPAPTPMFWGTIAAVLLIRRGGMATLTGFIAALIGFGATALAAGLFVELTFFLGRRLLIVKDRAIFNSSTLTWAMCAGGSAGLSIGLTILMMSAARDALPFHLIVLGIVVKIVLGVLYGAISHFIARKIFEAGVNPQGLRVSALLDPARG